MQPTTAVATSNTCSQLTLSIRTATAMTKLCLGLAAALLLAPGGSLHAQTPADSAAIRAAALDYIEGWYQGNADRMTRALHPDLAKRIVGSTPAGTSRLGHMTAADLIRMTGAQPPGDGRKGVRILDIFGSTASVRVDADGWIDYMHLARWNGDWKIINVLWELRP
jgi:hypothetical protein